MQAECRGVSSPQYLSPCGRGRGPLRSNGKVSNCLAVGSPVIGRAQGWRYAPPPPAAAGLAPVRSPGFWLGNWSVRSTDQAGAGRSCSGRRRLGAVGVPALAARDHGIEDVEELAHAGDERDLGGLALGDEPAIEGLEDGIVLGR